MSDQPEPDVMSPSQRQAIQKAWDILTEHFERVVVVADWEVEDEDGKREDAHEVWWHGGALSAIGAAMYAQDRLLKSGKKDNDPDTE